MIDDNDVYESIWGNCQECGFSYDSCTCDESYENEDVDGVLEAS